ncbi:ATP/GTP-binding protein [Streptomyces longwoodensis]|uniref:GTP-binding protein n=1 Tax=Streptomyces longwoodensis TaxID=68231 RepID=UPI0036FF3296
MSDGEDRSNMSNSHSGSHRLARAEELLKQLDRVDDAQPPTPSAADGLRELVDWMAEEQPPLQDPTDRPASPPLATPLYSVVSSDGPMEMEPHSQPSGLIKIIVVGGSRTGKTTFVKTASDLATTEVVLRSRDHLTGHGIASDAPTQTTTSRGTIVLDEQVVLGLFELSSEEELWGTWDDLARGVQGVVVLADVRSLEDCFAWLDYAEHRGLPFVVAINHFTGADRYAVDQIRAALDLPIESLVVDCDARERRSVIEVLSTLSNTTPIGTTLADLAISERRNGD